MNAGYGVGNLMVLSGNLNGQMAQLYVYYWNQNLFFYDANGVPFAQNVYVGPLT